MYNNGIVKIPCTPDIGVYTDDTDVSFSGTNIDALEVFANELMTKLSVWLARNGLELNSK